MQLYFPHIYESPYTINFLTGEIDPLLADGPLEEDETGAQFTLHDGIMFHDGEPLTADDVVYSIMLPAENDGIPYGQITDYVSKAKRSMSVPSASPTPPTASTRQWSASC